MKFNPLFAAISAAGVGAAYYAMGTCGDCNSDQTSCASCCNKAFAGGVVMLAGSTLFATAECAKLLALPPPWGPIAAAACEAAVLAGSGLGLHDMAGARDRCLANCIKKN